MEAKPKEPETITNQKVVKIKRLAVGTIEIKNHVSGMVQILDQQTGEKRAQFCNGCGSNTQVPAGTYKLHFPNFVVEGVEVGAGEKKVFDANTVAGTIQIKNHVSGMVQILDQRTGKERAGTYKLHFPNFTVDDVVVEAGQNVVIE